MGQFLRAAEWGLYDIYKRISEKSEDKNPANEYGLTPLHMAGIRSALSQYSSVDFSDEPKTALLRYY